MRSCRGQRRRPSRISEQSEREHYSHCSSSSSSTRIHRTSFCQVSCHLVTSYVYVRYIKKKKKKERNVVRNVRTIVQKKRIYGLWRWAKMAQVYRVVLCITMRDGATKSLVVVCKYAIWSDRDRLYRIRECVEFLSTKFCIYGAWTLEWFDSKKKLWHVIKFRNNTGTNISSSQLTTQKKVTVTKLFVANALNFS